MKNANVPKIIVTLLISSIIMGTSSFGVYSMVAKPRFYDYFMDLGNKYFLAAKYEEAILEFTKAIKIEDKSTEARVAAAKGYIGIDDIQNAVKLLREAQDIDIENIGLLAEIIEILRDVDPNGAYEMLMKYVNYVGKGNIPRSVQELLDSANEFPQIPMIDPPSGTYIKPVTVRLKSDKVRIGHAFYYTEDGTIPDKGSKQYSKPIYVEDNATINIVGYNPNGDSTQVVTLEYVIDTTSLVEIENFLEQCQTLLDSTEVGTEVGNCIEGAKEEFASVIEWANNMLEEDAVSYDDGLIIYQELSDAYHNFELKIIVPTDRMALESEIAEAKQLLASAVEGSQVGQYREGAKSILQEAIEAAVEVLEDLVARQETIDYMENELNFAIESFKGKKITEIDIIIAETGARIGPVTVSLLWHTNDDLDLYVTSPEGDTVYYGNKYTWTGGELDVDRQVTSFVPNPVENIYWDNPPFGTYNVKVNLYYKRSTGSIPFQVRVVKDGVAKIYDATIDDGTVNVCTFNY